PLGVGLPQGGQSPDEKRSCTGECQKYSPYFERRRDHQKRAKETDQPIYSKFDECTRERGAHTRRRNGVCIGKPIAHGQEASLGSKPQEEEKDDGVGQEGSSA